MRLLRRGLLYVLTGDVPAAAKLLAEAPGLGWSSEGHPGHVLFPALAGLLAEGTRATLSAELFRSLQEAPRDQLDMDWDNGDEERPKLSTPTIAELIGTAGRVLPRACSSGRNAGGNRGMGRRSAQGILALLRVPGGVPEGPDLDFVMTRPLSTSPFRWSRAACRSGQSTDLAGRQLRRQVPSH